MLDPKIEFLAVTPSIDGKIMVDATYPGNPTFKPIIWVSDEFPELAAHLYHETAAWVERKKDA